jgi:hypothetical protein
MIKRILILLIAVITTRTLSAGEGMWNLLMLDSLNYKDMQEKGLRLKPEDIYSINQASLKDAVVIFGRGCTGEVISPDGLVITNHHCGYSRIQAHSTVQNDYLTNGFWAGSKAEELSNPGLEVSFLISIEDVTGKILADIPDTLPESERTLLVAKKATALEQEAIAGTPYEAEIKAFYFGKSYCLFVYEIFSDVRLVGAPPEAIGRFGGDTDNWIWPRHTGDFSLFRIYADKNNSPAPYSPDNVPYKPKKYLSISVDGVQEGDFTMVLGYPGRTDEYLTSGGLQMIAQKSLPAKIEMRTLRLNALEEEMASSPEARLRYASRYVGVSNAWKKWIGVTQGVKRSDVLKRKGNFEQRFDRWAGGLEDDPNGYASLMNRFQSLYTVYEPLYLSNDLGHELLNSLELSDLVDDVQSHFYTMDDSTNQYKKIVLQKIIQSGRGFFKSNAAGIDRRIMARLMEIYANNVAQEYHPDFYRQVIKEFKGDYKAYTDFIFNQSAFTDSSRYMKLFSRSPVTIRKKLENDPLVIFYRDFSKTLILEVYKKTDSLNLELNFLYRTYISGMMMQDTSRILYPDANFTMRLAYGKVEGYQSSDAISYRYFTTLGGIIEKEDPEIEDYRVPEKLKALFRNRDFGPYASNGQMPVCFIASNHTSGGNSGSPVFNAEGNLVGINFDRNWEGTVSDYAYDPAICRNITLDIRYVLFVIDRVAEAHWLLDELTILKN